MKTRLRKWMPLVAILILAPYATYSQRIILSSKGDTLFVFTPSQEKFLIKQYYLAKDYKTQDSICEVQRKEADSIITDKQHSINNLKEEVKNDEKIIELRDYEVNKLMALVNEKEQEIKDREKEIRKQKRRKRFAQIAGTAATAVMTYLWIKDKN